MNYYFKRVRDNISLSRLYSYELGIAIIITVCFYLSADTPRMLSFTKTVLQVSTAAYTIITGKDVIKEMKEENKCNTYDLIRTILVGVLCIISFTCIDSLFR